MGAAELVELWKRERRRLQLRAGVANVTNRLNVVNFAGLFSGTAVEVTAIREIDGRVIGDGKPGPITRRIQETFNQAVRGQLPQYRRWLSFARQTVTHT